MGLILSQFRQYFPVNTDFFLSKAVHKLVVGQTLLAAGGVDLDLPKFSEFSFFVFPALISVSPSVIHRFFRQAIF